MTANVTHAVLLYMGKKGPKNCLGCYLTVCETSSSFLHSCMFHFISCSLREVLKAATQSIIRQMKTRNVCVFVEVRVRGGGENDLIGAGQRVSLFIRGGEVFFSFFPKTFK